VFEVARYVGVMDTRTLRILGGMLTLALVALGVSIGVSIAPDSRSDNALATQHAKAGQAARPAASAPKPATMRSATPRVQTADAVPRPERIATGYPNRQYQIRGAVYKPKNADVAVREVGVASWYGQPFHGRPTSSGERYNMYAMTAAHPTMPLPSYARVRNLSNGRSVIVRINDRGPFHGKRVIDLSYAAARKLKISGTAKVEVVRLTHAEIRTGAWRQAAPLRTASK
jgi:rare lipoprotein A